MAFRKLVEGECGGPNPLVRLTSHIVRDHGLKEEGIRHPLGAQEFPESLESEQLVDEFLRGAPACPQTFRMDNLLQEMREIDRNVNVPPGGQMVEPPGPDSAWVDQYLESGCHFNEHRPDSIWNPTAMEQTSKIQQEKHEFGLGPKWAAEYVEHSIDSVQMDMEKNLNEDIQNANDPNLADSKFMKFMRPGTSASEEEIELVAEAVPEIPERENVVDTQQEPDSEKSESCTDANPEEGVCNKVEEELSVAGNWINEYEKEYGSTDMDNYESAFWSHLQSDELSEKHPWISQYESFYDPFKEYTFHDENPMKKLTDPLEEGKKRLEIGDLPGAVLCFEAAVQQNESNAEAWLLLGKTQAENEQDPLAISALKRCLTIDPANSAALMALAVSYTNESYQQQACLTLKEWLLKNEKYKHLDVPNSNTDQHPKSGVSSILINDVHNEVKNLYIQAARLNPRNEIDPDVQCGLGVLFNLSNEYDKACDCFQAALQVRPDDSRLWSRLGATLANGQRSEEAINAYHRALELSPGFIRARYNLGISCINLGAYKEAGEHLLTALNQQAAGRGVEGQSIPPKTMSNTIWSTLRLVVSLMHKYHLNEAIEKRDLARLNKEFEIV